MKKLFSILILIFMSCSGEDGASNNNPLLDQITSDVTDGGWVISYYYDTDSDETANFSNFVFSFNDNGELSATDGVNAYLGSWSVTDSNSGDDSLDDLHFNIAFASPPYFAELTDDWDIVSQSASTIELINISGGNGGTDYLTFQKQ